MVDGTFKRRRPCDDGTFLGVSQMDIDELIDNFSFCDSWEDRYGYIIDLGSSLEGLDDKYKTADWKVPGCQSQVWLVPEYKDGRIHFRGDSDAIIVRGLIAVVLTVYNDKSPSEIKSIAIEDIFAKLGLQENLSPSRRNGLTSMVNKIKFYAEQGM